MEKAGYKTQFNCFSIVEGSSSLSDSIKKSI